MSGKEPQFVVTDRRKFTLDGDLREEESPANVSGEPPKAKESPAAAAPPPEEASAADAEDLMQGPTAEESARQTKDYQTSAGRLDDLLKPSSPLGAAAEPMDFSRLVQSIYMTAAMQMGAGAAPNEQPRIDILGARQSIDMLGVLEEKTKGNLTEAEKRLLQNALFDLRMSFLEISNAIASAAQKPTKPAPPRRER